MEQFSCHYRQRQPHSSQPCPAHCIRAMPGMHNITSPATAVAVLTMLQGMATVGSAPAAAALASPTAAAPLAEVRLPPRQPVLQGGAPHMRRLSTVDMSTSRLTRQVLFWKRSTRDYCCSCWYC